MPIASGGALLPGVAEVVAVAAPLLVPFLATGKQPPCEYGHGKDTPPPAWTVLVGGVVACKGHATGELER